ncbi:MAG TPA: peptidyl-prolyl cis-trans isomerase [Terracidiphilus sp.]|nr:peptidyl-prolyl cis-trans isomerase [Terracidiphilus sp.]
MKLRFAFLSLLFAAVSLVSAQVTSHTPTVFKNAPGTSGAVAPRIVDLAPVAIVNGATLTRADLIREEYTIFPYAKQHNGGIPKEFEKQIRDGAMKMIIFEELVYQEALRRKMMVPAQQLRRAETDFRKQFANPSEFKALLETEFHGSVEQLDEKIRRSILIEALLKSDVEDKCTVTPAEVRSFYEKNPARFHHSETFRFQTISVLPPANATAAQLREGHTRAQSALKQAKATKTAEEFGLLAEKMSDDDYRVMMGQHKPMAAEELAPQVVKALSTMRPNEMSDLIQVEKAYTIVRLQEHTPAGQARFEEVKAQLTKDMKESKKNRLRATLDAKLRQSAKIKEL